MNFWILAVALLAIPAAIISWPMFAGSAKERIVAMALLLTMPLIGLIIYQQIGSPIAINPPAALTAQPSLEDMVNDLQQRMLENPDDAEGWVILGRSLKTMRRYTEAKTALTNANHLMPGTPMIMVELAEASLFASGEPVISADIQTLLEDALAIDPLQQKGLWMLGMVAKQDGNDERAVELWQRLLDQVDPLSGIGQTVSQQIEQLGATAIAKVVETTEDHQNQPLASFALSVSITLSDEFSPPLPETAVLFIFIHPAGEKGMPLVVKRIPAPGFPLTTSLNNSNLLRPGTGLDSYSALDISARISMNGVANAASGDFQATVVEFDINAVKEIALHIAQRVP